MEYTSKNIGDLPFPKNVQQRVGMYLGSKGITGKMHTIEEIVANSIDEYAANPEKGGYGKRIDVKIIEKEINGKKYEGILVKDRGRGIPIDIHEKSGQPALTYILTNLHVGGKIANNAQNISYVASGGLNGIGASAVMAVSRYFEVTVARDGRVVRQAFAFGYPLYDMKDITPAEYSEECKDKKEFLIVENFDGKADLEKIKKENPDKCVIERGTEIFWITWDKEHEDDFEGLFDYGLVWDREKIKERLHELAYLNKELTIVFQDKDNGPIVFYEPEGIKKYLKDHGIDEDSDNVILPPLYFNGYIDNGEKKTMEVDGQEIPNPKFKFLIVEVSFAFALVKNQIVKHFVNNIPIQGGTQDTGLKLGIVNTLNDIAEKHGIFKNDSEKFKTDDIAPVLNLIMNIRIENPDFMGQTKDKLSNIEAKTLLRDFIYQSKRKDGVFKEWADKHLEETKKIIKTLIELRKERKKIESNFDKLLREKLSKEAKIKIAEKLSDCRSKDKNYTELFICEGDSAKGPIKNARNSEFQAVLPMSGKILKAWEINDMNKLAKNKEIGSIITALECGWHKGIDVDKCRYNKIIIISDADEDGYHITSLLITLFYRYFTKLIEDGRVYVCLAPLYEAIKGNEKVYLYNKEELKDFIMDEALKKYPDLDRKSLAMKVNEEIKKSNVFGWIIKRNKGLGEMTPEDMWNSTLDPAKRRLIQLKYNGDEEEFEILNVYMSSKPEYLEKRRSIISNLIIDDE